MKSYICIVAISIRFTFQKIDPHPIHDEGKERGEKLKKEWSHRWLYYRRRTEAAAAKEGPTFRGLRWDNPRRIDKAVRVSLMTRHTYKIRRRLCRAPSAGHNRFLNILVVGTVFVFAVLQTYNVLCADNTRIDSPVCTTYARMYLYLRVYTWTTGERRRGGIRVPPSMCILALSRVRVQVCNALTL